MAAPSFDPRVRLFVIGTWLDVTERVRQTAEISIVTGRKDQSKTPDPGTCTLTFENEDGAFSPRNPLSPFVGNLNRYTPIVVLLDESRDEFGRVVASGWSTTDTGETWATKSVGAPVNATDYSVDGQSGNHLIPAAAAYRMSYLGGASGMPTVYNGEVVTSFTLPFTNVTGGAVEPANLALRLQNDTQYYLARVTVETDETVRIRIMQDDSVTLVGPVTVPGIAHAAGQRVWVVAGAYDDTLYANAWVGTLDDRPEGWLVEVDDDTYGYGYFGVRTGAAAGNTNVPFTCSYGEVLVYPSQFNGEVPEWPQEFTDDGVAMTVTIEAGGVLRRLGDDEDDMGSSLRRYYAQVCDPPPVYFWALDGGSEAIGGAAVIGGNPLNFFGGTDSPPFFSSMDPKTVFGKAEFSSWLPNGASLGLLAELTNQDFVNTKPFLRLPVTDYFAVDFVRVGGIGTADSVLVSQNIGSGALWVVEFDQTADTITCEVQVNNVPTTLVTLTASGLPTNVFDGSPHHVRFDVVDAGSQRNWSLRVDSAVVADDSTATLMNTQLDVVVIQAFMLTDTTKRVGYQAVSLFTDIDVEDAINPTTALHGHSGEYTDNRFLRIMNEEGIRHFMAGFGTTVAVGPQFDDNLVAQFDEIARTDGGMYRELLSSRALQFDILGTLENLPVTATIDVGANQLSPPFRPVDDDKDLVNVVKANKREGGTFTYAETTGRLGSGDPKLGGAGPKKRNVAANPFSDDQLPGIAQRAVARGTVDKARFPSVAVNLMAPEVAGNLTLRRGALSTRVASRIRLTNMNRWHVYEDADLLVIGMQKVITPYRCEVEWTCAPYDTYRVFTLNTDRLGGEALLTADLPASGAATFQASPTGISLWTTDAGDFPMDVFVGGQPGIPGERVTISTVTGAAAPQTFTVSARAVNGVVSAWPAGSSVRPVVDAVLG